MNTRKLLSWGPNDEGQVCWPPLQPLDLPAQEAALKADLWAIAGIGKFAKVPGNLQAIIFMSTNVYRAPAV